MEIKKFSETPEGTLYALLVNAYSDFKGFNLLCNNDWMQFDKFIYSSLPLMDNNGFVMAEDNSIIGFMSWDPRELPESIEIGHNCIVKDHRGNGFGKKQLLLGLEIIKTLKPKNIIVKTGSIDFFKPAQRMYTSAGFKIKSITEKDNIMVPEVIEYELVL